MSSVFLVARRRSLNFPKPGQLACFFPLSPVLRGSGGKITESNWGPDWERKTGKSTPLPIFNLKTFLTLRVQPQNGVTGKEAQRLFFQGTEFLPCFDAIACGSWAGRNNVWRERSEPSFEGNQQ